MTHFYVNKNAQPTGEHEVHTSSCPFLPRVENRIYLGMFNTCAEAIIAARRYYLNVDGCYYCCHGCHKK